MPVFCKGLLEVRANAWGFANYNAVEPCSECPCNRSTIPYTDLSSTARWRELVLALDMYIARAKHPLHPLLACRWVWRFFFPLDCMHIMDCNGCTSIVAASVIRHLVLQERRLGANQQTRMNNINTLLVAFYDARPNSHRMPAIRLSNLVNEAGWAQLHGRAVKAANTRGLTPFLVQLAQAYYGDENDDYSRLVLRAVRHLDRFYNIMYDSGPFFTSDQLAEFKRVALRLGAATQQLTEAARLQGFLAWHIVPKMHYMMHLGALAECINPRFVHNYMEESQVGSMTKIWGRSAHGKYRREAQRLVLIKRLTALYIRLEQSA